MHAELPSLINPFPEYIAINRQFEIGVLTKSSVSDIVTNVNLLLGNEAKYDLLKSNCKKAKDVFNWLQEEKELVRLYKENIGE